MKYYRGGKVKLGLKSEVKDKPFRMPYVVFTKRVWAIISIITLLILSCAILLIFFSQRAPQKMASIESLETERVEYGPSEDVKALVKVRSLTAQNLTNLSLAIRLEDALGSEIESRARQMDLAPFSTEEFAFDFQVKELFIAGYVLRASLCSSDGSILDKRSWIFNVSPDWTKTARLTLFADFNGRWYNATTLVRRLKENHVSVLQLWNWEPYWGNYLPTSDEYESLSCEAGGPNQVSLSLVTEIINLAQKSGIKVMLYVNAYGAHENFYQTHKDWALLGSDGRPIKFYRDNYAMRLYPSSPWHQHLVEQCTEAVRRFKVDGIHLDDLGRGFQTDDVDPAYALAKLMEDIRDGVKSVNPNAIVEGNTWEIPVEPADIMYQEEDAVWVEITSLAEYPGPHPTYGKFDQLLRKEGARAASHGKPLWVQLNFPHETSWALLTALTLSNRANLFKGGYTLQSSNPEGWTHVRSYFSFATRYAAFIYSDGNETESVGDLPQGLVARTYRITFKGKTYLITHLVNVGNLDARWDRTTTVNLVRNLNLKINIGADNVTRVHFASPDVEDGEASTLQFDLADQVLETSIPSLRYYGLIIVEIELT